MWRDLISRMWFIVVVRRESERVSQSQAPSPPDECMDTPVGFEGKWAANKWGCEGAHYQRNGDFGWSPQF